MFGDAPRPQGPNAAAFHKPGLFENPMKQARGDAGSPLADYWRLAVKHRWLIAGALLAAMALGIIATLLMTPIFTASTTLQIDREAARVVNVDDVSPRESMIQGEEFFQTQYGLLRSRSLAERVIDDLGLARNDTFLNTMGVELPDRKESAAAKSARRRDAVLAALRLNLGVSPVRGSRLVTVTFDSPDPQVSAKVANAFAENFIQANLDRKYESSSYARQFLEERLVQTKAKLEEAERELVRYAGQQRIINVREASDENGAPQSLAATDLATINASLSRATADRIGAEQKWARARSASLFSLPEVVENPAIQRLTEEKAKVQAQIEDKSRVYREDWPEIQQLRSQSAELDRQITSIASGIRESIRGEYVIAANQERALRSQVEGLKSDVLDVRNRSVQYNILQREVDTSRALYDGLLQRYKEVGVTGGISSNNISVVDPADAPDEPSKPRLLVNLALAALLGLGLGFGAAFILEALDESLASPDDVENKLNISVLGVIPLLDKGQSPIQALEDIRSPFSEAYYSLRTALQFSTPNGAPGSILVTSSRPAEGKSTTAYAIALNLARIGKKVLLIDGDLRNPSMHRLMGVDNHEGVSNYLAGSQTIESVTRTTRWENLSFVPCGPLPPNPAELWGGDRIRNLFAAQDQNYDHIVIDGPPVLGFADAPLLASAVQGTVFVMEARGTRRAQARGALRRLLVGNGRLIGGVLTKFNTKATQYGAYDYSYDYNYGPNAGPKRGKA